MGLFGKKGVNRNGFLNRIANPNPNGPGLLGRIANPSQGGGGLLGRIFGRNNQNNTQPTNYQDPNNRPNNGNGSSW
jgi:hypothetical protein